jgi:nitroimidazol reductase NimA-like FMN-containing flavoprotein (pyridoxamine 5'-phosphate oxidase superfamily)
VDYKYQKSLVISLANLEFSDAEKDFLNNNEACRLATCHDGMPHVVPVSYVFEDGRFYVATDYETKKYENINLDNRVALLVDVYDSVDNKAVSVQGTAEIIENGEDFARLYGIFYNRFEWVRRDPWDEGEAPFIKISLNKKVSWGLM